MPPKTKREASYLWSQKPHIMRRWKRKGQHKPTGGRVKRRSRRKR